MWAQWADWTYVTHLYKTRHKSPNIKWQKTAVYLNMSKNVIFCPFQCNTLPPLGPNVNSWDFLGAFTELTFSLNVKFVCIQWADFECHWLTLFSAFFETIHDPLSAIFCPLGPNVNRCCHPRRVQRKHISLFCDLCEHNG